MKDNTTPVTKDEIIDQLAKVDKRRHEIQEFAPNAETEGDGVGILLSIATYLRMYKELEKKVWKIKDSTERKEAVVELARML